MSAMEIRSKKKKKFLLLDSTNNQVKLTARINNFKKLSLLRESIIYEEEKESTGSQRQIDIII